MVEQIKKEKKVVVVIKHKKIVKDNVDRYLCNQATKTNINKLSLQWDKVNCKNCLKLKNKPVKKVIVKKAVEKKV